MSGEKRAMDGNSAAAYVSYAFTDVAAIYPITPSSTMANEVDEYSSMGKENLFRKKVVVKEMQSEAAQYMVCSQPVHLQQLIRLLRDCF